MGLAQPHRLLSTIRHPGFIVINKPTRRQYRESYIAHGADCVEYKASHRAKVVEILLFINMKSLKYYYEKLLSKNNMLR